MIVLSLKKCLQHALCVVLLMSAVTTSYAQPPRGPFVISPQVHPDKKVTFRYLAPTAREVKLAGGQFGANQVPMTRDSVGIWSVTVGPVRPDIYPYNFVVDGVGVMDPANVAYFPNERFKASLVDIPGFTPLIHSLRDVPHGTVRYEYYPALQNTTGQVVVYTPPGYEKNTTKKYPVFYLISGTTDTEETWFKVGKTNLILDNLIAEGKMEPMIVVMPYGNIEARIAEQQGAAKPGDPMAREDTSAIKRMQNFSDDLTRHIIPYIDKSYRTIPSRDKRAIGGFSRGGGQTLRTAFWNMDKFAWICVYSAYLPENEMETRYKELVSDVTAMNNKLKLLWVGVGVQDFLYNSTAAFMNYLTEKKIKYKSLVSDGGHTWMNTKLYLTETAQLLFK